jgi:hypothetical protein
MSGARAGLGRPLRVALYARVSTRDKDQDPELQLDAMRDYVRTRLGGRRVRGHGSCRRPRGADLEAIVAGGRDEDGVLDGDPGHPVDRDRSLVVRQRIGGAPPSRRSVPGEAAGPGGGSDIDGRRGG